MKLTGDEVDKLQTKHEIVAPVRQEYRKIGRVVLRRGMMLYEFDVEERRLEAVKVDRKEAAVDMKGRAVRSGRAMYNPKAIYVEALNGKRKVLEFMVENGFLR